MSDFDDIFKSSFEDYEMSVPDDMWSRIQDSQDPEDKKVPFWIFYKWYLVGSILLLGLSFSALYFYSSNQKEAIIEEPQLIATSSEVPDFKSLLKASKEADIEKDNFLQKQEISSHSVERSSNAKKTMNISSITLLEDQTIEGAYAQSIYTKDSGVAGIQQNNRSIVKVEPIIDIQRPLDFQLALDLDESLKPDYDTKCPKFGKSSTGYFSLEAYHSSDHNIRSLKAKSEEYDSYALKRNETESARYSFSDGLKMKWHSNFGLVIGIGVERSQINERFVFTDEDSREVKVLITIDTLFMPDGSFTTSTDTTRIDINGIKMNDIHNSYTSIDLPINLSYQLELNKWAIALNAGVHLNLLFSQKGRILDLSNKPAWITNGASNEIQAFQAKSGLKFDGSISIIYHLTDQVDIMAEPYFKYNSNSYTLEKYQLEQNYHTIGIRTGVRYNFGF